MELNALDILVLVGILLGNLALGLALSRRAGRGADDYYLAGRSLPWWLVGTSMVATTFALDTPLVIAEYVVNGGLFENWLWISLALSHLFVALLLAPQWRRSGAMTDVELCEMRYSGRGAALLRAVKSLFFALILNGIALSGVFLAVRSLCEGFGYGEVTILGIGAAEWALAGALLLTVLYSASAGLWGVVTTDAVQFGLALVGACLVAWLALSHPAVGGLSGLRDGLEEVSIARRVDRAWDGGEGWALGPPRREPPLSLAPSGFGGAPEASARIPGFDDRGMTLLVFLLVMWWAWKFSDGGGVLIQRMLAAKDERHATWGMLWFCLAHYVLRWWPWALAGLSAILIFEGQGLNGTEAYARTVAEVVPQGLRGLILAYFLAAFMSTVDTHLQLASSYIVNDLYKRFLVPEASGRHYVWVGRGTTVAVLLLAVAASTLWGSFKQIYLFVLNLVAGAGVVFLARWFWWRVNAWSEVSALAASLIIGGGLSLLGPLGWGLISLPAWSVTLINVGGSLVVWLTVTALTPACELGGLVGFYERVRPFGAWGPVRARAEVQAPRWPWRALGAWVASVTAVFVSLFAIRDALAGDVLRALIEGGVALAGGLWVACALPKLLAGAPAEPHASGDGRARLAR